MPRGGLFQAVRQLRDLLPRNKVIYCLLWGTRLCGASSLRLFFQTSKLLAHPNDVLAYLQGLLVFIHDVLNRKPSVSPMVHRPGTSPLRVGWYGHRSSSEYGCNGRDVADSLVVSSEVRCQSNIRAPSCSASSRFHYIVQSPKCTGGLGLSFPPMHYCQCVRYERNTELIGFLVSVQYTIQP